MTLYIVSIGFDVTHILAEVSRTKPSRGDIFYFIRPKESGEEDEALKKKRDDAEIAIESVFEVLNKFSNIRYKFLDVDDTDFTSTVLEIFDNTMYIDGKIYLDPIIVWAVGGTKSLVAILVLYGQVDPRVRKIYGFTERTGDFIEIPSVNKEYVYRKDMVKKIYDLLYSLEYNTQKISKIGSKILNKLVDDGLIIKGRGRGGKLEITDLGRIYRRRYEIRIAMEQ